MNSKLPLEFYKQQVEESFLPFWNRALDKKNGGVFTCFNNFSDKLISKDKYIWSQGRLIWLWTKIASMISEGKLNGDKTEYLEHAGKTVHFLEKNVFLENGNCAFLLTETGEKKESISGKGYDTSIYADFFVIMGLAKYAGFTHDRIRFERALALYNHTMDRLSKGSFRSEPYPVPEGYLPHALPMIMMYVTQEMSDAAGMLNHEIYQNLNERNNFFMNQVLEDFTEKDGRVVEMLPLDNSDRHSLLYRHFNPGHTIECMWFIMHGAHREQNKAYIDKAVQVIVKAVELGWDDEYGGLFRFTDMYGGKPKGEFKGTEYEKLVLDTWDMKLWWPHSESLYATLLALKLTGNPKMKELYEMFFEYTFDVFPHPDPAIGEWIHIRNRKGDPLDKVVALPVKDPFHIFRNLLLIIDLLEEDIYGHDS